jgi:hypothetical protein
MWESPFWSFGWLLPLFGIVMCLACMFAMLRGGAGGHFPCHGWHHGRDRDSRPVEGDPQADVRREIRALREELDQLKLTSRRS